MGSRQAITRCNATRARQRVVLQSSITAVMFRERDHTPTLGSPPALGAFKFKDLIVHVSLQFTPSVAMRAKKPTWHQAACF